MNAAQLLDMIRFYKLNLEHKLIRSVDTSTGEKFDIMTIVIRPVNHKAYGLLEEYRIPTEDVREALEIFHEHVLAEKERS